MIQKLATAQSLYVMAHETAHFGLSPLPVSEACAPFYNKGIRQTVSFILLNLRT